MILNKKDKQRMMDMAVITMIICAFTLGWVAQTLLEILLPKWF